MYTVTFEIGRGHGKYLWERSFSEKLQPVTLLDKWASLQVFSKFFVYFR